MNEKFYNLPIEKQMRIINAGYKVFSQNSYKKSPVGEIAAEAGISKSLLFHYFINKKELYLFLQKKCIEITQKTLEDDGCFEPEDLFEGMLLGLRSKIKIMKEYPDLGMFAIRCYYETDPEVCGEVADFISGNYSFQGPGIEKWDKWFNPEHFVPGLDLKMMYRDMFLASEGYIWEMYQTGHINVDVFEAEYVKLLDFWKSIYLRKE